ncbi:APC family permease [Millisia brevis]|uniref:APC family permease n=1 Tax=Millisia brevis TaxID=264148 RepID=UPI000835E9A7|nr:APC family permease [Millisia brevis]
MRALQRAIADPPRVSGVTSESPMAGLERRSIGFVDVLAQSVGAVAPAAVAATMPALVAAQAPRAVLWSLLAAWVLIAGVGVSLSVFTKRLRAPGSLYTFVTRGLGPSAGLITAVAQTVGYAFVAMFGLLGAAVVGRNLIAGAGGDVGVTGSTAAGVILGGAVVLLVLRRGIRISARITLVIESVALALILVLIVVVLVRSSPAELIEPLRAPAPALGALVAGTTIAITGFVGFESGASLGREATRPFLTIPRTLRWTVIVVGAVYLLAVWVQEVATSSLGVPLAGNDDVAGALARAADAPGLVVLLDIGLITSFVACAIASSTALSRVWFSLGREAVLPGAFGTADPLRGTPRVALAVVVPMAVIVPLAMVVAGIEPWHAMSILISISAVGYIASYLLLCAAVTPFLRRLGEVTWPVVTLAIVMTAVLTVILVAYLIVLARTQTGALWAVAVVAVLGAVGYLGLRLTKRSAIESMGRFDETTSADLLGGS